MADLLRDLDFFHLDEMLTTEERATRDTVRRFVSREVLPQVERHFAGETFPTELIPQMAELGMFGANLKGYGCAGMNNVARANDGASRLPTQVCAPCSVQSSLSMYAIHANGTEEQKSVTCPRWRKES